MSDDVQIFYQYTVKVGDIIRSPYFEHLLFRDILTQDAFCGFWVNPMKVSKTWDFQRTEMLENPGRMRRTTVGVGKANNYVNLKHSIDHTKEFVVIYTQRNTDCIPEILKENEAVGTYPLMVIAKMLDPEGEYDPNGIEIYFHMETENAKHAVPEVISCGFMHITHKRIF